MKQLPPVNQHEIEKQFYELISRPEHRGFQADFARQLGHKDDSYVSRMHSPHFPEARSWLYKAAVKLDAAARADVEVAQQAVAILQSVVSRFVKSDESGRFPSSEVFNLADRELNSTGPFPLAQRIAAYNHVISLLTQCRDQLSGGENGQQRGGREAKPRSVQAATIR